MTKKGRDGLQTQKCYGKQEKSAAFLPTVPILNCLNRMRERLIR